MKIDPATVPHRQLASGALMPAIGLGTFGSDRVSADDVAQAVGGAYEIGYRHFDCAAAYNNEAAIGEVLKHMPREELWVTSKLWNDMHSAGDVARACHQTLADLQLSYLDLYLVHWPFPNVHDPGCDVGARNPNSRGYLHDEFMQTWQQMEQLVETGLVRHIGTSNMTVAKMQLLLRDATIAPVANQMELHPHFQQPELFEYLRQHQIQPVGFCPIGSPARPERDRAPDDTVDIEDPLILKIAEAHGVNPAVVCVKWAIQRGQVPIPFSTKASHYTANLAGVAAPPLSNAEMDLISGIDKGNRLIKGQVFLWKENQSWEDLWDLDGRIAS